MKNSIIKTAILACIAVLAPSACVSDLCTPGTETCPCAEQNACEGELVCLSDTCVDAQGGGSGSGGGEPSSGGGAKPPTTPAKFVSDAFDSTKLGKHWRILDRVGDVKVRPNGTSLVFSIPRGQSHDLWSGSGNLAPRVLQKTNDGNFGVEVKLESAPSQAFQMQGIIVQETDDRLLRLCTYSDGSKNHVLAMLINGGTDQTFGTVDVPESPERLRVVRDGHDWTLSYALPGGKFVTAVKFTQPMKVSELGLYAATSGSFPGFSAIFDYFSNLKDPVVDKDSPTAPPVAIGAPAFTSSPVVSAKPGVPYFYTVVAQDPDASDAITLTAPDLPSWLSFFDNRDGSGTLSGTPTAGDLGDAPVTIQASDPSGKATLQEFTIKVSEDAVPQEGPPAIVPWTGDNIVFGQAGVAQRWLNVPGTVADDGMVVSLTASLNGTEPKAVPLGSDGFRLFNPGDFNIEVDTRDLLPTPSMNLLHLVARDDSGEESSLMVSISFKGGTAVPLPYVADWGDAASIAELAQLVDGYWQKTGSNIRTVEPGYDRLIAIGDASWPANYEVTLAFTIHSVINGDSPAVGFAFGWQGHQGSANPRLEWPLEAISWIRGFPFQSKLQILTYPETVQAEISPTELPRIGPKDLQANVTYRMRARCELLGNDRKEISTKLWPASSAEPAAWDLSAELPVYETTKGAGSILLIAHMSDVTFGKVTVLPLQ